MPTLRAAFEFLEAEGPRLFPNVTSMLYVGHRLDTHPWWHETFAPQLGVTNVVVLDLVSANAHTADHITKNIVVGDVRTVPIEGFGVVFWDEGPEHLPRSEALEVVQRLAQRNSHVLVSCPWGYQPQGGGPEDPEFHHWGPLPEDFAAIGLTTATFGTIFPGGHGNLVAWS